MMLKQFLYLHWKSARWAILLFAPVCFALPLLAVRFAQQNTSGIDPNFVAGALLATLQVWVPLFPLIAGLVGVTLALTAWSWDHGTHHIYALSLPLPRWEYALQKFLAGALLLGIPVLAMYIGALLGVSLIDLPEGLHAYPFSLGGRFLLAALLSYALLFALAAGTVKTTIRLFSGFVLFLIFGSLAAEFIQSVLGLERIYTPFHLMDAVLMRWPGPFHVFGGNWMLIDV
jgi:hypothetical protein